MWKLVSVKAKNLCAFKEFNYQLRQGCTTLVFGNNMDNDSQGSNGSGKSAMLEAIAIGLTGEPLRKIKMDEIINDAEDKAVVEIMMHNQTGYYMSVNRCISRKSPQSISIHVGDSLNTLGEVVQATVADYNKYVLEQIGLKKDDLYSNFILSKNKYTSFLSSSDREKKEIINRFSNGNLVDESIEALKADIVPVEQSLSEANTEVAVVNGRIDTLRQQIEMAKEESAERFKKKNERIAEWKQAIIYKRAFIREQNKLIDNKNKLLDMFADCNDKLQDFEESDMNVSECYNQICSIIKPLSINIPDDYESQVAEYQERIAYLESELNALDRSSFEKILESVTSDYKQVKTSYDKFQRDYGVQCESIQERIDSLLQSIKLLEKDNSQLQSQRSSLVQDIANIEKQLAGVIKCPKCGHEFTLADNVDIHEARLKLQDRRGEVKDIEDVIASNNKNIEIFVANGREVRKRQNELEQTYSSWSKKLTVSQSAVDKATQGISNISRKITSIKEQIFECTKSISNTRKRLFDDVFESFDSVYKAHESEIDMANLNIKNAEGAIQSYEESIKEIESAADTDILSNLKSSLKINERELTESISRQEAIQKKLDEYKVQEATFIEFKTHLANTKIEALNHITNELLEEIGSDIKIALSRYTVLKSGKVRDKISISLLRDGIDCGSFDKFSAGERARVELATILAMHKLTNTCCEDEKGIDLLVLDEILEAVDEQGLNNIFNALNKLQITALVVSHGNIAEGYPYKTVVNKLNGVSYLNEQQQ